MLYVRGTAQPRCLFNFMIIFFSNLRHNSADELLTFVRCIVWGTSPFNNCEHFVANMNALK